jgi:hypothetical protein
LTPPSALIDLHVHTSASDGELSPGEVVHAAKEAGLGAIAVTDHDTVAGLPDALAAGRRENLEVVPGVEISAEFPGGTMHILGYFIDFTSVPFLAALREFQRNRAERNPRILAKLAALGLPLEYGAVLAKARGETVGRPHIAAAMIETGYVRSADEAFGKYLARGAPAYVERRRATPQEAIRLVHEAGGAAVLAHPRQLNRPMLEIRRAVAQLAELGLQGLEVYHTDHTADETRAYRLWADELGLVATGGTDFHGGRIRDGTRLGVGRGNLRIPYEILAQLRQHLPAGPTGARHNCG